MVRGLKSWAETHMDDVLANRATYDAPALSLDLLATGDTARTTAAVHTALPVAARVSNWS